MGLEVKKASHRFWVEYYCWLQLRRQTGSERWVNAPEVVCGRGCAWEGLCVAGVVCGRAGV